MQVWQVWMGRLGRVAVVAAAITAGLAAGLVAAATVEEKFPDGTIQRKYNTDANGRKSGFYHEFHPGGKAAIKTAYREDRLHGAYTEYSAAGKITRQCTYSGGNLEGAYTEFDDNGAKVLTATYKGGKLDGWLTRFEGGKITESVGYADGVLLYPRSPALIKQTLAKIGGPTPAPPRMPTEGGPAGKRPRPRPTVPDPAPAAKGKEGGNDREDALRRLKAYRYLCELAYEDVTLDDEYNRLAEAGSRLCKAIGRLDHTPANPGWPEAQYKDGYAGTSRSNLFMGRTNLASTVDGYMDDSDPSNIDRVGHRRWCLNPKMSKTGFGKDGVFSAMYAFDSGRTDPPDYETVCYPARGLFPVEYFGSRHAWSISLKPGKFSRPSKETIKVKVRQTDAKANPVGEPLELDYFNIDNGGFGEGSCIIFRLKQQSVVPGKRYWVEVEGLETRRGDPAGLRYMVEFFSLSAN